MLRRALKIVAFPLAVLAVFGLLYAIWLALDLPPEATIIAIGKGYLDRYGLWIVLVCGFIEALVVIGWYFPGTLVIIFAMMPRRPARCRYVPEAAIERLGSTAARYEFLAATRLYRIPARLGLRDPWRKPGRLTNRPGVIFSTYGSHLGVVISRPPYPAISSGACPMAFGAGSGWVWATLIFCSAARVPLAGFLMTA